MLAAAAEATWTECGVAVAKKLANTKLEGVVNDPLASITKKVIEVRKALEQADGKALLKVAGQHIAKVTDPEVWTTTLRDRRNALHWGKAKSFVADHSETGTLLMAAPAPGNAGSDSGGLLKRVRDNHSPEPRRRHAEPHTLRGVSGFSPSCQRRRSQPAAIKWSALKKGNG
jgi:hypothetical protein